MRNTYGKSTVICYCSILIAHNTGEVMNMIIHDRIDTNLNYHHGEVIGAY